MTEDTREISEHKRLEEALRAAEERFRTLVQFSFDVYWETDARHRFVRQDFANALADAPKAGSEIGKTRWEVPYLEPDEEAWRRHRAMLDAHVPFHDFELARPTPGGGRRYVSVSGYPKFDAAGRFTGYRGVGRHISERKHAEAEHRAYVRLLECMHRIDGAMRRSNDLEQTVSDALDTVLDIFDCDRAWLIHPCDPHAQSWRAVMERTRPGSAPAFAGEEGLPMDAAMADVFAAARAASGVVLLLPSPLAERFEIGAQMAIALHPKGDIPYLFGVHQISRARSWTDDDQRLFEAIGSRLADALTTLLMFRNLRESERRVEAAQRIAHVGWWERDFITSHVSLSDESCRIFGVQPVELPHWHGRWLSLIHPEDSARAAAASDAALGGGPRYDIEYRVVRPDGTVRVVHSQGDVTRDESGRPVRQFGVMQDITELRRAEDELRASEARFRSFVDHATDAFFLLDEQLIVVDVNRQACENLGWSRKELIGMRPRDFDAGLDERSIASLAERARAGETITFETNHRRKDGTAFPVEIRTRMFGQGDQRFYLALARDVTERKLAAETVRGKDHALQVARAELARVSRVTTLGELTASIAHEVNQPLGAMVANAAACARWLAARPPDVRKTRQALESISADGKRAGEIIGRIRALTRRQPPSRARLDVNRKILDVLEFAEAELRSREVVVDTRLDSDLPPVSGDRVQLQQVLLNLIVNAIDAMDAVHDRPRALTIVSKRDGPDCVAVEVHDSGTGLEPEAAGRLFEAFFTTKPEGVGIGLSISRSIVEAHGGQISVSANAPHGAVFRFTLPLAEEESS